MTLRLGFWDVMLVVAVSVQATTLAYMYDPRWKAFLLSLPIPFTIASLAVGRPIDATNVLGLVVLLIFTNAVRLLYHRLHFPIVAAIVASAALYCAIGWGVGLVLPAGNLVFWISSLATLLLALYMLRHFPHREEQGHRSPLPVYIKLPIIVCVICTLVLIKQGLKGFMTVFPMVGVVAAYEARHSLWTISRQIPILMIILVPMMVTIHIAQGWVGFGNALALGWVVMLSMLIPITRYRWSTEQAAELETAGEPAE